MKFTVIGPDKQKKMSTEYVELIPYEHLSSMASAGYKFVVDGKTVGKVQVDALNPEKRQSRGNAKAVWVIVCKDTGETFKTQSDAAKHFNIDPAQVSDSIKTGRPRSGYTFEKILT